MPLSLSMDLQETYTYAKIWTALRVCTIIRKEYWGWWICKCRCAPFTYQLCYVCETNRKATASKMRKLGRDRQLTISHECLEHDCKMARWWMDGNSKCCAAWQHIRPASKAQPAAPQPPKEAPWGNEAAPGKKQRHCSQWAIQFSSLLGVGVPLELYCNGKTWQRTLESTELMDLQSQSRAQWIKPNTCKSL